MEQSVLMPSFQTGTRAMSFILLLLAVALYANMVRRKRLPLPPGPKGLPIIGNLFDMPKVKPWMTYRKWAEKFKSDIIFLQLPFQPVIILDSIEAATDLMEKRSNIYSDKLCSVMDQLVGWDWNLALMPYNSRMRNIRRIFHKHFNPTVIHRYRSVQTREVHSYLRRTLETKMDIVDSFNQLFSAIILDVTYGIRLEDMDDPYINVVKETGESFGRIRVPGAFLVDTFPILRHVPTWMPGASHHKFAQIHKPKVEAMVDQPFIAAKEDVIKGVPKNSIAHEAIRHLQDVYGSSTNYERHEGYVKDAAGVVYGAGVETSYTTASWFVTAMVLYPDVQKKAQSELDRVLGTSRLPVLDDRSALPYTEALLLETLRWIPSVPLGIPHRSMMEDEYRGYHIPKGTITVPNIWDMAHNPRDYPNPEKFDPARFLKDGQLNPDVQEPTDIVFGFGRRMCPGRFFAKESLFLAFASILTVFNIEPAIDANGVPVVPDIDAAGDGILLHPKRIDCIFKPRSVEAYKLIKETT